MDEPLFDDLLQLRMDRAHANAGFDTQEAQVIALIRAKGYSWDDIGKALGVTRQSAWEKYVRQVEEVLRHADPHPPAS